MRRLESLVLLHLFSMLVVGVGVGVCFACYSSPGGGLPSLSLQDRAQRSAVVIEGKVQSSVPSAAAGTGTGTNKNASAAGEGEQQEQHQQQQPHSVSVRVLDVWPRSSGGLAREQLVTVTKNRKYIFFMDATDEPSVFTASFSPLDTSAKNLKREVGKILCEDCGLTELRQSAPVQYGMIPAGNLFLRERGAALRTV
ncbi:hypothetical protein AAFF_G00311280 [Aldrovandia affinis]|uniref:Neuregulin 2 N-terminal domain-containing protein n=1 Tax=Aldrovandia affinis TaxID=143900 RepID=A0AAD7R7V1_9TELE|nr:hypothetical protein AAFF_G00311280 [Aldrovandia affinis]